MSSNTEVSTRIRLARNLKNYPFPCRMTAEQKAAVVREVSEALCADKEKNWEILNIKDIPEMRAQYLVEQHLISAEFAVGDGTVILNKERTISIMLNEEDHIRIQVLLPGEKLDEALELANQVDDILDEKLEYAFDKHLGYLTQCPTNLGTGLRASVMLHLPVLTVKRGIGSLSKALGKFGMTVRGIYGEGSEATGCMYQISNQVTLGLSEDEAVENLKNVVHQISERENTERDGLFKANMRVADRVYRAIGTLKYARLLSSEEFMGLISDVRMGVCQGEIKGITTDELDKIILRAQPAAISDGAGKVLSAHERDVKRAELVRKEFAGC